jgi:hypothetical protein
MKKYINAAGYSFTKQYNDLTNKQYALESVTYGDSENTTFSNIVLDRVEVYKLFLKEIDPDTFGTKLETILASALSDNVNVATGNNISVENVENGYLITLQFEIKGQ